MSEPAVILLVEDSEDDVRLTERAFRKAEVHARIDVVSDGLEALEYLFATGRYLSRKTAPLPTLVLLDLKMPRLDGHEVLERIRADGRTRRLPVIVLTSSLEDADVARSYDRGVNSYLCKPVSFEKFVEAARRLGIYWLELNCPPPPSTDEESP